MSSQDTLFLGIVILIAFLGLFALFLFGWWLSRSRTGVSPYTGNPLRPATDLQWFSKERILRFLFEKNDYYNQLINFEKAAFCRDTGRVFPDCVTWYGSISVDWSFIQKRIPGTFVSWGSLTDDQRLEIIAKHDSLDAFQTMESSKIPSPRLVEPRFAFTKPGPLYVDIATGVLVGWQLVPETELEVLIVKRPIQR